MSEYIFVTNIFEYSNIRIYSSHSGSHVMSAADIIYEQPSYDDGGAGDSNVGDDNGEGGLPLDGCGPLDGT